MVNTDLSGVDDRLREIIATARKNRSILEPLLAHHEILRQKYERAERRPWQKVKPDPPMPTKPRVR